MINEISFKNVHFKFAHGYIAIAARCSLQGRAAEPGKTRGGDHVGAVLRLLLAHLPVPLGPSLPAAAPSPLNVGGVGAGLQEHGSASSLPQPCPQGHSLPFPEHTD